MSGELDTQATAFPCPTHGQTATPGSLSNELTDNKVYRLLRAKQCLPTTETLIKIDRASLLALIATPDIPKAGKQRLLQLSPDT